MYDYIIFVGDCCLEDAVLSQGVIRELQVI